MVSVNERDKELSIIGHLDELRRRLTMTAFAVGITTVIAFTFAEHIIRILLEPSGLPRCVALSPTENFGTFMNVALFSGIALAMPVLIYEMFAYVSPALFPKERRFALTLGPFVMGMFLAGMAFCYFLLLPQAIKFLINFGSAVIENQLRCSEYISFVTTFVLGMGLVFEMPAVIFGLTKLGIVKRSWLARQRRYVVLLVFLTAAVITPTPDPVNQTLVALPMYLLFEFGLLLARFAGGPRPAA